MDLCDRGCDEALQLQCRRGCTIMGPTAQLTHLLRLTVLRNDQTNRHSDPAEQYLRELTGRQFRGRTSECCLTYSHRLLLAAAILPPP